MSNNLAKDMDFCDLLSFELFSNLENKKVFEQLIFNGADINYKTKTGWNILFEAVSKDLDEVIVKLIELKIDLNIRDNKGRNALFWAIYYRNIKCIKKLISLGIDTKVTSALTAVNYAVYRNDIKVLRVLKNCGLNLHEKDDVNSTPLIYAVLYNRLQSIDYLLENKACIKHRDFLGNSAYTLAKDLKIRYLIDKFEKLA